MQPILDPRGFLAVRHFCLKRNRIAEINVPAWPMPTQNTKLTIGYPHITGLLLPQTPTPVTKRYPMRMPSIDINENEIANAIHQDFGGFAASLPLRISFVTSPNSVCLNTNWARWRGSSPVLLELLACCVDINGAIRPPLHRHRLGLSAVQDTSFDS